MLQYRYSGWMCIDSYNSRATGDDEDGNYVGLNNQNYELADGHIRIVITNWDGSTVEKRVGDYIGTVCFVQDSVLDYSVHVGDPVQVTSGLVVLPQGHKPKQAIYNKQLLTLTPRDDSIVQFDSMSKGTGIENGVATGEGKTTFHTINQGGFPNAFYSYLDPDNPRPSTQNNFWKSATNSSPNSDDYTITVEHVYSAPNITTTNYYDTTDQSTIHITQTYTPDGIVDQSDYAYNNSS
ncbi:hypothetical protein [Citrobacter farmeri]|uniref:hypothetical protein n=1 Tax=Citrobacter farmeri TaxID=67824 RepID=UPI0019001526|nr:hypothetical protein [Citrobacter farmeri]MBJ9134423.1 hypothetical protein [Citrobacter farmeri]